MPAAPVNWKECFSEWLIFQYRIAKHRTASMLPACAPFSSDVKGCELLIPIIEAKITASLVVIVVILIFVIIFIRIVMRLVHLVIPELTIEAILFNQIMV